MKTSRALIFVMLSVLLLSCQQKGMKTEEGQALAQERKLTAVETAEVQKKTLEKRREYVGDVAVVRQVSVIPLASEQILRFPWENGDYVKEGEVIAEIRNVVSKQGAAQLSAQMRALDVQLKAAQRESQRISDLFNSNIVSKQTLDQTKDGVLALQAQREQLAAAQRQAKLGLEYSTVLAPISGVVSKKLLQVGDIASSAMPLCVLLDLSEMKVTLNIAEADASYLKLGQEVELRFDAYPKDSVKAKINRIMPYINPMTRTNTVEAVFTNPTEGDSGLYRYKPGMFARANILLGQTEGAIVVQQRAMLMDSDLLEQQRLGQALRKVFVLKDDDTVEARVVELGERSARDVEVIRGLELGERLVIRGQHSLKEGEKVRDMTEKYAAATSDAASTTL
ncbi:MAG: efflux RND transporter periplasmic adaptor subunit [Bradymonadales bacterium]|jgi:RND family efflux transporter MFP subunit